MITHRPARRTLLALAFATTALTLAGCSSASTPASGPQPTPTAGTVFTQTISPAVLNMKLTDQDGKQVSLSQFKGKALAIAPFLTLCQEICPFTSANYRDVDQTLKADGATSDVELIEVTVDPWRDDVKHLKAYQKLFGAQPNWVFLTGTKVQLTSFWKAFYLGFDKTPNAAGETPHDWLTGAAMTFDVQHQNILYTVDANQKLRWLIDGSAWTAHSPLPAAMKAFLSDEGKDNYAKRQSQTWTTSDLLQGLAFAADRPFPQASS